MSKTFTREKWEQLKFDVLAATDIEQAYKDLGVVVSGKGASSKGWLPCHAAGRDDRSPSAAINISDGTNRGKYKDLGGTGESLGLFDFAAKYGGYATWYEACKEYGKKAGLAKRFPKGDQEQPEDKLLFKTFNPAFLNGLIRDYKEFKFEAIKAVGGELACYPKRSIEPQYVLAVPAFKPGGTSKSDIRGYVIQRGDGKKLQIYQGEDHPPKFEKRALIGSSGLMGLHGLLHLEEAELIWKVEGYSDLIALQGIIPKDLRDKHIVITNAAGAHETGIVAECADCLAGKKLAILHDNDEAGQQGAGNWIGGLKGVVESIRNVLIERKEGCDVKDIRAWISDRGTYSDLLELYSKSREFVDGNGSTKDESGDSDQPHHEEDGKPRPSSTHAHGNTHDIARSFAALTPEQQLLKKLGIVVLGEVEGSKGIVCFSRELAKMVEIKSWRGYNVEEFAQDFGDKVLKQWVNWDRTGKQDPSKYSIDHIRLAISIEAGKRRITGKNQLGVGIWELNGRLILVNSNEIAILNGKFERIVTPTVEDKMVDFGSSDPWYDFDDLCDLYNKSADRKWCQGVYKKAIDLFAKWDNWCIDDSPKILTALISCSWLQTIWPYRPSVAVCGPTNSGKTTLYVETIGKFFGKLVISGQKSTEAGIRQGIGNTARIMMLDEFENDSHREKILELLRTSSRGGHIFRGTAGGQKGIQFSIKHIPWVSAIEVGLRRAPDRNRFIFLSLDAVPEGKGSGLTAPPVEESERLGMELLAVALRHWREVIEMFKEVIKTPFQGVDRRIVESFALPCAMLAAVEGSGPDGLKTIMKEIFSKRDLSEQGEKDEAALLQEIYEAIVIMPHGDQASVSEILGKGYPGPSPDMIQALERNGIKAYDDAMGTRRIFFNKKAIRARLLKGTDFFNQDINQILLRIPGAENSRQKVLGHFPRGVCIPEAKIHELIGDKPERPRSLDGFESV